ncbi:MAG: helix-turn-helix domain-containing protein [Ktedonobacteraceae bacterium]
MPVLEHGPIMANENERPALTQIRGALADRNQVPKLVGSDGQYIELPQSIFEVLRQIVSHMMSGRAIFIVPETKTLTTQEAADVLGVSRPYLIKLLDQHKMPYTRLGLHRRILFSDLMRYREQRDRERERALDDIAQMSQDLGMYDD